MKLSSNKSLIVCFCSENRPQQSFDDFAWQSRSGMTWYFSLLSTVNCNLRQKSKKSRGIHLRNNHDSNKNGLIILTIGSVASYKNHVYLQSGQKCSLKMTCWTSWCFSFMWQPAKADFFIFFPPFFFDDLWR